MSISVATWNINSVRLRQPMVLDFLKKQQPDVLCLQEIKCQNDQFPAKGFTEAGYEHHAVNGQKSYHGVAIVSRLPLSDHHAKEFCEMGDARHISAVVDAPFGATRIHNFYIPAGGDEANPKTNPKFKHKLDFLDEMQEWFDTKEFDNNQVIVGDFNIAPHENDVWSHKKLLKVVSHTPIETEFLDALLERRSWVDVVRKHIPTQEKLFSWWSYRSKDWNAADKGRRLDHIWSTADVAEHSSKTEVFRELRGWEEKPSDHVPIVTTFG